MKRFPPSISIPHYNPKRNILAKLTQNFNCHQYSSWENSKMLVFISQSNKRTLTCDERIRNNS